MGAKRPRHPAMAAPCALLLLLLLVLLLPAQAAGKSKFCRCFDDCFPGCADRHVPGFLCKLFCANKCSPNQQAAAATCSMACSKLSIRICGWSAAPAAGAADTATCVQSCNRKLSQMARTD